MRLSASRKNLIALAVATALTGFSTAAMAGAFQLFEQNAVTLGDFGAGGAAIAEDASTSWYNPAGMVRLKTPEVVLSAVDIHTDIKYSGVNAWNTSVAMIPLTPFSQHGTAQAGGHNFIPAFHIVAPIPEYHMAVGFSVAPAFGLETDYPWNGFTRYSATETSIKDIDFSPSVAFALNNHLSIGGGIDPQYIDANFDSVAGVPSVLQAFNRAFSGAPPLPANFLDTRSSNEGKGWGYGWHVGLLWQSDQHTRFGFTYRSSSHFHLTGTSTFSGRLANGLSNSDFINYYILNKPFQPATTLTSHNLQTNIILPATITFSVYHELNDRWAVMGTAINTQWHTFKELDLSNVAGLDAKGNPTTHLDVNAPEHYHDSWRLSAGAQYKCNKKWLLRFGGGYDQSPVNPVYRDIRLPDEQRLVLSVGTHYQPTRRIGIDVGWTHMFIKDAKVNSTTIQGTQIVTDVGTAHSHADMVGAQLTLKLA